MCVREIPHQQAVSVRDFRVEQRVITEKIYILTLASQNDPKPHTRILNKMQNMIMREQKIPHKLTVSVRNFRI